MKKRAISIAALVVVVGAAAVCYRGSTKMGKEMFDILTPASDELDEELLLQGSTDVLIADDTVPLDGGPGVEGGDGPQAVQESPYVGQVIALVNEERAKVGLPPLEKADDVSMAAAIRVKETTASFSHTRPDGSAYRTVLDQSGISYRNCGENIAYGYRTPEAVVSAWMDSEGHRANILNDRYDSIGIGYCKDSSGLAYWVQLFTLKR